MARAKIAVSNIKANTDKSVVVVDIGAGEKIRKLSVDYFPCITKSRAQRMAFVLLKRGWCRQVSLNELAMLQGARLSSFELEGLSASQIGGLIGNAMARNCLDRLLPRVLQSVGAIATLPPDKWANEEPAACI